MRKLKYSDEYYADLKAAKTLMREEQRIERIRLAQELQAARALVKERARVRRDAHNRSTRPSRASRNTPEAITERRAVRVARTANNRSKAAVERYARIQNGLAAGKTLEQIREDHAAGRDDRMKDRQLIRDQRRVDMLTMTLQVARDRAAYWDGVARAAHDALRQGYGDAAIADQVTRAANRAVGQVKMAQQRLDAAIKSLCLFRNNA